MVVPTEVSILPFDQGHILAGLDGREIARKISQISLRNSAAQHLKERKKSSPARNSAAQHLKERKKSSPARFNFDHSVDKKEDVESVKKEPERYKERAPNYELDPDGPGDKYNFVLILFFVLGIIHIAPYSFFYAANEFWFYKFRDVTSNSTDANDRTWLQANFFSIGQLVTAPPSTVVQFLLIFFGHKISANLRVFGALATHAAIFLFQMTFVEINTDSWQVPFFVMIQISQAIMVSSLIIGAAGNMVVVAVFPDQYLKSYLLGQGFSSLITALIRLVSVVSTRNKVTAGLIYYITGSLIMILSTLVFYFATKLPFYKHYTKNMHEATKKSVPRIPEFREVLGYVWPILVITALDEVFIRFRSVVNLVVSEDFGSGSAWADIYFVTILTYLVPAICEVLGRVAFYKFELNPDMGIYFVIYLAREIVFTVLYFMVNAKPRHHLPLLLPHDWQYGLVGALHAFSKSYLSNVISLKSIRMVPAEQIELSWLLQLFVFKIMSLACSPIDLLALIFFAHIGEELSLQSKKTIGICSNKRDKIVLSGKETALYKQLFLLSQQASHRREAVTAGGFFNVDHSMILFILTTFGSYFVVVVQIIFSKK